MAVGVGWTVGISTRDCVKFLETSFSVDGGKAVTTTVISSSKLTEGFDVRHPVSRS